uniref:CSON005956 protein n=2 Tax=Culicoides sonorensis TaxID=179676 RepID=A0A336M7Q2_CULSO
MTLARNVTALSGKSAYLSCRVINLGNKTVSFVRHRDLHILTVGTYTYTSDQRFTATYHRDINEWTLQIKWAQKRDAGAYECQISTQPVKSFSIDLNIVVNLQLMKQAKGYFKPAYTDPQHYPDDVIAPIFVSYANNKRRQFADVFPNILKQKSPQHAADAPSFFESPLPSLSSSSSKQHKASSSIFVSGISSLSNTHNHRKLNDDYHIGNKINMVASQIGAITKQQQQNLNDPITERELHHDGGVPTATILGGPDDLYVDKGSSINLTCLIRFSPEPPNYIFWYHQNEVLSEEARNNIKIHFEQQDNAAISYLLIRKADFTDSGTYKCDPANAEVVSIRVNVLNGERPEAMQTGSSNLANKTNRLFIILVISYIFEYFIPVFNLYSNVSYEGRR